MKYRQFIVIIMIFLCGGLQTLHAQHNPANLTNYSEMEGNNIFDVLADQFGNIWMATHNGLVRFDGYEFTRFYNDPNDPASISIILVSSLYEDSRGRIWIGGMSDINMFDPKTNAFRSFPFAHLRYDDERQVWNGLIDKHPALIVKCRGTSDVIHAVNFARENKLQVSIRGGGHNVAGLALIDNGLVIDLSDMRGVHVDPDSKTAIVEGGAIWADVDRETQLYGLAAPGGVVSTTGVAGLTLGGGLGRLRKKHGLSCDNLLSVRIVTAEGKLLTANEHENSDLFWAVRGGGGNFGIVTSFEFNLHEVGPQVMFCLPMYPMEMAEKVLSFWRDFMVSSPDEVSSEALFWSIPDVEDFPEEARGKSIVGIPAMYSGDPDEGQRVLQPLREIGETVIDMSGQYPFAVVESMFDWAFPKNERNYYFKSTNLRSLDDEVIKAIISKGEDRPVPSMLIAIWHYGGEMNRVPAQDTAFGSRDTSFLLSVDSIWDDPSDSEKVIAWSRNVLDEMKPHSGNGMYPNFPGFGEEGNELVKSAYGKNYDRLSKIKAKYDPDNFFSVNLNIKPA